jgi:hypothetical protein
MTKFFSQREMQAIADALGDTSDGLTGSEIGHLLTTCKMVDPTPDMTKRHRLYNAFAASQNGRQDRRAILAFIRHSMKPASYARQPERYELMRAKLNRALAFAGLAVDEAGTLISVEQARTLSEAQRRAPMIFVRIWSYGAFILTCSAFVAKSCSPTTISMQCLRRRRASRTNFASARACRTVEARWSIEPWAATCLCSPSIP